MSANVPLPASVSDGGVAASQLPRMGRVDELARYGRLLLLQGPNGPFFHRLTLRLRALGATVTRVNFNAGDDFFHPRHDALCFDDHLSAWPAYLERLLLNRSIRAVVLFGQDRVPHAMARSVCMRMGIPVVVFEEGYVRPCWITMEMGGVNARSAVARNPVPEEAAPPHHKEHERFDWAFWAMAWYTGWYGLWGSLFRHRYPRYQHHKPLQCREGLYWMRATARKLVYAVTQRRLKRELVSAEGPSFFLVPLQMALDSQILHYSSWAGNEPFIESVIRSFAAHASEADHLVFKHHPLEIGHAHYGATIRRIAAECGVAARVHYIHGGHLPSLLTRAKGVVLVNSTVGLQALHHGTPVFATGSALYVKPGLVSTDQLHRFWRAPVPPDPVKVERFIGHLIARTQVNASFYAPGGNWSDSELQTGRAQKLLPLGAAAPADPAGPARAAVVAIAPPISAEQPVAHAARPAVLRVPEAVALELVD